MEQFSRTALLIGKEGLEKLNKSKVIVFGVGGVGGYTVEALARAGVGALTLVDGDRVSESNINRQIIADYNTLGKYKTEAFSERIGAINPDCRVRCVNEFILPENLEALELDTYDFIVDAIDTVSTKIALAEYCDKRNLNLISSMGTGNKLDPAAFEITDVYKTSVCPLARAMRAELKRRGVCRLTVIFSKETPKRFDTPAGTGKKPSPASISFVPAAAGLMIGGYVIKRLAKIP